jgi:hypothetical protein
VVHLRYDGQQRALLERERRQMEGTLTTPQVRAGVSAYRRDVTACLRRPGPSPRPQGRLRLLTDWIVLPGGRVLDFRVSAPAAWRGTPAAACLAARARAFRLGLARRVSCLRDVPLEFEILP